MEKGPRSQWNPYRHVDAKIGERLKSLQLSFIISKQLPRALKQETIPIFQLKLLTRTLSDVLVKFPKAHALRNKIAKLFGSKIERLLLDVNDQNRFKSGRELLAIVNNNLGKEMKMEVCRHVLSRDNLISEDLNQIAALADIMKLLDSIEEKLALTGFAVQRLIQDGKEEKLNRAAAFIRMLDGEDFKTKTLDMAPRLLLFASAIITQNGRAGEMVERISKLWENLVHKHTT